ncbi:unnamed protein product [Brassica napus]|uniref:(rape) hypothetical protein n=1 Tax=Brassica napus TaxID=3708 RepID=A0A816M1K7_BRANA|nr:unnamed protein product [Brassica napus]
MSSRNQTRQRVRSMLQTPGRAFSLETLFSKANEPNKKTSTSLFQTRVKEVLNDE